MKADQRQIAHLDGLDRQEIENYISAVQVAFGEEWLNGSSDHLVRTLWKRADAAATNELLNLGYSLIEADKKKVGLAASFAKNIKKQDLNNQRGLLFELFVIGGMNAKYGSVHPTPANEPGYDLRVSFDDGGELLLSLKSWGSSQHERTFRKKAEDLERYIQKVAHKSGCHSINIRASATEYPNEKAWGSLRSFIQDVLKNQPLQRVAYSVGVEWELVVGPVWSPNGPLSENSLSHEVFVVAPYHGNEIPNFRDKLQGAIQNAEAHVDIAPNRGYGIIARVPGTLSWSDANEVASTHLSSHPNGPIGIILLVQTAVVTDRDNRSAQHFYVKPHISPAYPSWSSPKRAFGLSLLLGGISGNAPMTLIALDNGQSLDLGKNYSYHSGDLFVMFDGNEGVLSRLAPGLRQHAVMRVDEKELILQGKFPQNDNLVLFD